MIKNIIRNIDVFDDGVTFGDGMGVVAGVGGVTGIIVGVESEVDEGVEPCGNDVVAEGAKGVGCVTGGCVQFKTNPLRDTPDEPFIPTIRPLPPLHVNGATTVPNPEP